MESDGIEWNGVGWSHVPLFGFVKKEWNGMECDGTHSIRYHSFIQFSIPPIWGVSNRMEHINNTFTVLALLLLLFFFITRA